LLKCFQNKRFHRESLGWGYGLTSLGSEDTNY